MFGTSFNQSPLIMVPSGPNLMQGHPTVLANTTSPVSHITKTPVPTVRSQPTADGSVSGSVQVSTTSGMHKHQEVNLISYFVLAVAFRIFFVLLSLWCLENWSNTVLGVLHVTNTQCDSSHQAPRLCLLDRMSFICLLD